MKPPDTLVVDGHAVSRRHLCRLRRQQIQEWKKHRPDQPALFEMKEDARPMAERRATGRYRKPSLLHWLDDEAG